MALDDCVNRLVKRVKSDRNGAVLPGIVQFVAAIGREHELDPTPFGGIVERAQLVARGTRHDEYPSGFRHPTRDVRPRTSDLRPFRHTRATCSVVGSAQQYQGSFR
jgi:hypothetical protein